MNAMIKRWVSILSLCGLMLSPAAEAKKVSMTWFVRANVPISRSVTAISPFLQAKCAADVKTGQLDLTMNGLKRSITPNQNSAFFSRINGKPSEEKYGYNYTILWKVDSSVHQDLVVLTCQGDNFRTD
jgi:hypothetical protein